jgi:hypothetical protein
MTVCVAGGGGVRAAAIYSRTGTAKLVAISKAPHPYAETGPP